MRSIAKVPTDWFKAGSQPDNYEVGIDYEKEPYGKVSAYIKSVIESHFGFGTLMQMCRADVYRGKRVRMSARVKVENVQQWAGMWFRVDGENESQLAFDNMGDRPLSGNTKWTRCEIVLDVVQEAAFLAFGVLLQSTGQVWITDINFEIVGDDVPVTNKDKKFDGLPERPANLNFQS